MTVKTKSLTDAVQAAAPTVQVAPSFHKLQLVDPIQRYIYLGKLYDNEHDYEFVEKDAKHMLNLKSPNGGPVFRVARKRAPVITRTDPGSDRPVDSVDLLPQTAASPFRGLVPEPVDLSAGEDDPEILAKLAGIDGPDDDGLVDTGTQRAISV